MTFDMAIEGRFVDPIDGEHYGYIGIEGERIAYISERPITGRRNIRLASSELLFPGFIDTHVHFREPGWEHKATIYSESRAAARGGVTTAMDMVNNQKQTTSRERVLEKRAIAERDSAIDLEFYGGIGEGNLYAFREMAQVVPAFKMQMGETTGTLNLDDLDDIEEGFAQAKGLLSPYTGEQIPIALHCEHQPVLDRAAERYGSRFNELGPMMHSLMRPGEAETEAIYHALGFSDSYGVPVTICHVSTKRGLELIREHGRAKSEATIHHQVLCQDDLSRLGAFGKMNPPLRPREDMEYVSGSMVGGNVDFLATDHAPHTREEKEAGFVQAPSGVPSVEHYGGFACLLLERGMEPKQLARATSYNAAQFYGFHEKGRIEEGYLANLTVLERTSMKRCTEIGPPYQTKCGWSPFEGMDFPGRAAYTIVRGKIVAEMGGLLV